MLFFHTFEVGRKSCSGRRNECRTNLAFDVGHSIPRINGALTFAAGNGVNPNFLNLSVRFPVVLPQPIT